MSWRDAEEAGWRTGKHVANNFRPTMTVDSLRIEFLFSFGGCHGSLDPVRVYGSGRAMAYILTLSSGRSLYFPTVGYPKFR